MKKILLGSTVLVGAAALFSGAALADTPKVTLGGNSIFEVGIENDDQDSLGANHTAGVATDSRPDSFRTQNTVNIKVDGKADSGLGYGGEVDLEGDTSTDSNAAGVNARKTFIYTEGGWGRFEMGSEVGADSTLKVDAASIARATGGIAGDWTYFVHNANNTRYLAQPMLPVAYGVGGSAGTNSFFASGQTASGFGDSSEENVNKITYYTPRFSGFQVGVSFSPDDESRGQQNTTLRNNVGNNLPGLGGGALGNCAVAPAGSAGSLCSEQNIVSGGVSYDTKYDNVGIALAATGEEGQSQDSTFYENLRAYQVGGKLSLGGWSIAGSYGNWGDSYRAKADQANDSFYYTGGVAYETGPFGVSATYLGSKYSKGDAGVTAPSGAVSPVFSGGANKFEQLSLGTDYKLAPGLTPFAELNFFDANAADNFNDNKGALLLIGTQLAF